MRHDPRPHHIQVNIDQAAYQVCIGVNGGGVVAVLPECALALFALVEFLGGPSGNQLHALRYHFITGIENQQVDMVRGGDVIQYAKAKALSRLEQPMPPAIPVSGEFEQKFLLVTAVRDMPDVAWQEMTTARGMILLP